MTDAAVGHPPTRTEPVTQHAEPLPRRVLDALLDATVLSFALWTLLYWLGLPTQWSLWPSGWLWAVATAVLLAWRLRAAYTDHGAGDPESSPDRRASPPSRRPAGQQAAARYSPWLLAAGLACTVLAGIGGLVWTVPTFRMTWLALVGAGVLLLGWAAVSGRATGATPDRDSGGADAADAADAPGPGTPGGPGLLRAWRQRPWVEDLLVLGLAAATAVAASLIHLTDTDDPYYVNRSVWVAEHGNAALRDTMFSPEVYNSPYGGGVPISSIEALFGVLAHMTETYAGTITYLVATPVGAVLSVLAMWRLARRWAPARPLLVLLGAWAFLMLSGASMLGNFWIVRMWQGKVVAVAIVLPLIWAYLTELHEAPPRRRRWLLLLLLATGVAFAGLTPTAVVWAPLVLAAVAVAAVLVRSRTLFWGGVAVSVGPVLSGLAVVLWSTGVGGEDPEALSARASFVRILGTAEPMVALGIVALALAAVLARRGAPSALAGAAALGSVLAFAPGVLPLVNAVTGSGPILWRMLYVAPIPVLAGLLLAVPLARGGLGRPGALRLVAAGTAALTLVALLAAGGRPIWSHTGHNGPVTVTRTPQWKVNLGALADVRRLVDRGVTGLVLLPPLRMKTLTMYSTQAFPVVPREWFIQNIDEPRKVRRARHLLHDVAAGKPPFPPADRVDRALALLEVDLACTGESPYRDHVMRLYAQAGYTDTEQVGSLSCARPVAGG